MRTTELLVSNPVKNPARFVRCRSGSGQIIAIRFRPEFPLRSRSYTGIGSRVLYTNENNC